VKDAGPAPWQAPSSSVSKGRRATLTAFRIFGFPVAPPSRRRSFVLPQTIAKRKRKARAAPSALPGESLDQFEPVEPNRLPPSVALPTLVSPITLIIEGLPDLNARSSAGMICSGVSTCSPWHPISAKILS
jgi:hypothetical protein